MDITVIWDASIAAELGDFGHSLTVMLAVSGVVMLGAVVQGTIGFGFGLIAAPLMAILSPELVPVVVILLVVALPLLSIIREAGGADWTGVSWALAGRVPGTVVGALTVAIVSSRLLTMLVGLSVLAAVGSSLVKWIPRLTARNLITAGFISGFAGTAASIGGPPVALLYQKVEGPRLRGTMSAFLAVGGILSVLALSAAGQVGLAHIAAAAILGVPMGAGFAVSGPLRGVVDRGATRSLVLALCTGSAVIALLHAFL